MTETSQSLLERLRENPDEECWRQLTQIYRPLILRWLERLQAPAAEADDLAQDVLMVVMRKLPEFSHNERRGAFRSWLRTITANCLRDLWKARRIRPQPEGGSDFQQFLHEMADPKSELSCRWNREHDQHVTAAMLRQIKGDFEAQSWQAFELMTLESKSATEAAEILGMNRSAVYAAKSRIMSRLRTEAAGILENIEG